MKPKEEKSMKRLLGLWVGVCALLLGLTAQAADLWQTAAPWVSAETFLVAEADFGDVKLAETFSQTLEKCRPILKKTLAKGSQSAARLKEIEAQIQAADAQFAVLRQAGATRLFFLMNAPKDEKGEPEFLFFLPMDVRNREAAAKLQELWKNATEKADDLAENMLLTEVEGGMMLVSLAKEGAKLDPKSVKTAPRPELEKAFQKAGDTCFRLAISLTQKDLAKSIAESGHPKDFLPDSIAIGVDAKKCVVYAVFPSETNAAKAAEWLNKTAPQHLLQTLQNADESARPFLTDMISWLVELTTPTQTGDTLALNLSERLASFLNQRFDFMRQYANYVRAQAKADTFDTEADAKRLTAKIQPWMTESTLGLVRVDLQRLKLAEAYAALKNTAVQLLPETMKQAEEQKVLAKITPVLDYLENCRKAIVAAGGKDIVALVDPTAPTPVMLLVPLEKTDAENVTAVRNAIYDLPLMPAEEKADLQKHLVSGVRDNVLALWWTKIEVSNVPDFFDYTIENTTFASREGLENALISANDAAMQVTFLMTPLAKTAISSGLAMANQNRDASAENETPKLKLPSAKVLIRGLDIVTFKLDFHKPIYTTEIHSKTEKAAQNFMHAYEKMVEWMTEDALQNVAKEITDPLVRSILYDWMSYTQSISGAKINGNRISVNSWDSLGWLDGKDKFLNIDNPQVVCAVAGVGVALLLPAVQQARHAARRAQMANNFKQCTLAMLNFEAQHAHFSAPYTVDKDGNRLHSWRVYLLPYLEQVELFKKIRLDEPWDSEWNSQFHKISIPGFQSPLQKLKPGEATIAVVVGDETAFPAPKKPNNPVGIRVHQIRDGMSNTIMFVECLPVCWMDPNGDVPYEEAVKGIDKSDRGIRSFDGKNFIVGVCDGSVQMFLSEKVQDALDKLEQLLQRADGTPTWEELQ